MRILLVEDDSRIARFVNKGLSEEGYAVDIVANGEDALTYAGSAPYDLIILDLLLPKIDGITVCRHLRRHDMKVPILILTAKDSIEDRVTGLNAGADDYLVKPFAFTELVARVRALLRRPPVVNADTLEVGDLVVDVTRHHVQRADETVNLTPKGYSLLVFMMRNQCQVLSRTQIMEHV